MSRFFTLFCCVLFLGCNNEQKLSSAEGSEDRTYYPYGAQYSSDYRLGNTDHTKKVLEIWRAFERKSIATKKGYFADSICMVLLSGRIAGKKDSVLAEVQRRWEQYPTIQSYPHTWMPVYYPDKEESRVYIWANQERSDEKGASHGMLLHEMWCLDKEGRITFMRQYSGQY